MNESAENLVILVNIVICVVFNQGFHEVQQIFFVKIQRDMQLG